MYKDKIETCGKRIEQALILRNMRQSELCEKAGVPKSSLSLYLRGAYEPKQDRICMMAEALNVSEIWLMGYDVPLERSHHQLFTTNELTDSERIMLELFRQIPVAQQKILIQIMRDGLCTKQ